MCINLYVSTLNSERDFFLCVLFFLNLKLKKIKENFIRLTHICEHVELETIYIFIDVV